VGCPPSLRAVPTQQKSPTHFGVPVTEEDIDVAANTKIVNAGHIFMAYTGDPASYCDTLYTLHLKGWEIVLGIKCNQLTQTGTFEWVKDIP
jgi:hypothetical protein